MPLNLLLRRIALLLTAALISANLLKAQIELHDWYRSNDPRSFPFSAGSISTEAGGYALSATSVFQKTENDTAKTVSLGRIDSSGSLLWTLSSTISSLNLSADASSADHAFAWLSEPQHLEFARINGETQIINYSIRYLLNTTLANAELKFLPSSRVGILQNLGSALQLTIFNPNGYLVFENNYSSAGFLSETPDANSSQSARLHTIDGSSDYFLTVLKSIPNPIKSTFNNTVFLLCISDQGQLKWSKSFAIETASRTQDHTSVVDGDLLLALPDTTVGIPGQPFSSVPSTHFALVSPTGTLLFSQTLEGFSYGGSPALVHGGSLLIAGSSPSSSGLFATNAALVSISKSDGTIERQTGFDSMETESLHLLDQKEKTLFATISSDTQGTSQSVLLSIDETFQATAAKQTANETMRIDSESNPYLSVFLPSKAAVGAIQLNAALDPMTESATTLLDATYESVDPQIHAANLEIDLLNLTVFTEQTSPTLTTASVTYETLSVEHYYGDPLSISAPISATLTIDDNATANLSFKAEYGYEYELQRSSLPTGNFATIGSLIGAGEMTRLSTEITLGSPTFFRILKSNTVSED